MLSPRTRSPPSTIQPTFTHPSQLSGPSSASFGHNPSQMQAILPTTTLSLQNGDIYEGEVNQKGQMHGYGKYKYVNKNHEYHGNFQNGLPHGQGKLYRNAKDKDNKILVYEGGWKYGKRNGEGRYYYNSQGHYYQGDWFDGQRHGNNGTYSGPMGTYTGKWKNGLMEGRGQFYSNSSQTKYMGNFSTNQFVNGTLAYSNGDEYTGSLKNGARDDKQGRYTYNKLNNIKYSGGWKLDKKNDEFGMGSITYPNNDVLKSVYRNGDWMEAGECIYQWADGTTFKGWIKRDISNNNSNRGLVLKGFIKQSNGREYQV